MRNPSLEIPRISSASHSSPGEHGGLAPSHSVEVNYGTKTELGTGLMNGDTLFMTNCHVIEHEVAASGARISFDRELDELGRPRPETTYTLDPAPLPCVLIAD